MPKAVFNNNIILGSAAVAEIEHRQQAGAAMRADDHAETGYRYLSKVGVRLLQLVAYIFRVGAAVSLKNVHLQPIGVDLRKVGLCAVKDGIDRGLAPANLFATSSVPPSGTYSTGLIASIPPTSAAAFDTRPPALR